jgi:hypothetical protein
MCARLWASSQCVERVLEVCDMVRLAPFVEEPSKGDNADRSTAALAIDGATPTGTSDRKRLTDRLGAAARAAAMRRGEQGALATAVRDLRSHSRSGDIR